MNKLTLEASIPCGSFTWLWKTRMFKRPNIYKWDIDHLCDSKLSDNQKVVDRFFQVLNQSMESLNLGIYLGFTPVMWSV